MRNLIIFVSFLRTVFCVWDADSYWNSRYAANGIDYNADDTANGMWSDNPDKYMKDYPWSQSCSGCDCTTLIQDKILQGCDGLAKIVLHSFPKIINSTFAPSTTSITIQDCTPFTISEDAFTKLTSLTSLTIQKCGITTMPYIDQSPLTILNLIENEINVISTYKGKLPSTIEYLALTHNQFHWIPDRFITGNNLRLVSLGYNNLTNFPLSGFGSLPNLMYLGLEGNLLKKISVRHLTPFITDSFVHLNLSNNLIDYVQPGAFKQLPNLKIIEMHSNYLSSLPRGTFENLTELLHLDLHGNHFEIFNTEALIDLENLIELRLHSQTPSMTTILFNSMINIGKSLKNLFVSDNALTHLPHQVFTEGDFPQLTELHADHNRIENMTALDQKGYGVKLRQTFLEKQRQLVPFGNTTHIVTMYLQNNIIDHVTNTDLCELIHLQNLHLQANRLDENNIEYDAFKCLPSLLYLDLGRNYLMEYVPVAVTTKEKLPAVQTLSMSGCHITFLESDTFRNITTLRTLYLQDNDIVAIEDGTFPSKIREINLNNNRFRFIHEHQFTDLTNLQQLHLAGNEIDYLPDEAFTNCFNLTSLSLNSNKIPQLKKVHLQNCPLTGIVTFAQNHIGWIEDGTFAHISEMISLDLSNNRLYWIPNGGDFNNLIIEPTKSLSLENNRISVLPPGSFKNLEAGYLYLQNNRIYSISSEALESVSITYNIDLSGNRIREIQSFAFKDITVDNLVMSNMYIGTLPSYAFSNFQANEVDLQNSEITNIMQFAFDKFKVIGNKGNLYLNNNRLTSLYTSIFGENSEVYRFHLNNNGMTKVATNAFRNLTVTTMYLNDNLLTTYPFALSYVKPTQIDIYNNRISEIPTGSLAGQTNLRRFSMYDNLLTHIPSDLFADASNIQKIDIHSNKIQQIDEGAFAGLSRLLELDLSINEIPYFPSIDLPELKTLSLQNNLIETLGGISTPNKITNLNLDNNPLGCECSTTGSLYNALSALSSETQCSTPADVFGVLFASSKATDPLYYENIDRTLFQCSAENIIGSADSSTSITISWTKPSQKFALFGVNSTEANTNTGEVWEYIITCTSITASTLQKSVSSSANSLDVSLIDTDGVLPMTSYECVIQTKIGGYTSAKSIPVFVSTPPVSNTGGPTVGPSDILLNITFYDFSFGNDDFSSTSGLLQKSPYHVISPLGSWLSISDNPKSDTFSDWFRSASTNFIKHDQILLEYDTSITTSTVHKFWQNTFFPVDGFGFDAEGQTDCSGDLHNFAFTSAIRTGMKFQATEKITVGGGEELWLFINKKLVIELVSDRSSGSISCKSVDLSPAKGGGTIIPQEGYIVNGECTGSTPVSSSSFTLELEVDETYLFEIFHVERMGCSSELLIKLEDVHLAVGDNDVRPFHYKFFVQEDLHLNGIVATFPVWGVFSVGPTFRLEILSGNQARHFSLKSDTSANRNLGTTTAPPTYTYYDLYGGNISFVECVGSNTLTPEPNIPGTETFTVTSTNVLLTISSQLDYEMVTDYILYLELEDEGTNLAGNLVIKIVVIDVNDHCPLLSLTEDVYITPQPLLQKPPLLTVNATDMDSGNNSVFYFYVSTVHTERPSIDYDESLDIRREVYNETTELTVTLAVIDEGVPPRGSAINITVNISNTCLLNEHFKKTNFTFSVNKTSGEFFLRVPGYWTVDFQCKDDIGISNGIVRDELITASSSRDYRSLPARGRLWLNASEPILGPLTGGWVASPDDTNPYIQVYLEYPYKITKVHIQGQQDQPNWVTAFQISYSNDGVVWNLYQDNLGEFIFLGNNDQNTVKSLDLSPAIFAHYVRINPRNWTGNAALRMELSGCTQAEQYYFDTSCERCYTSYYCLGDGESHTCGRCENDTTACERSPTEHTFGAASECSTCPKGWICKDGYASPCPENHYAECNDTFCPEACMPCESGYACRGGQRYICQPGTYADGTVEFCNLCTEGTYQDLPGQDSCKSCPAGYYSSTSKDRCDPCEYGTYSVGDGSGACLGCTSDNECPCQKENTCFSTDLCVNTGSGGYQCLGCPTGYIGDGITCSDIDECTEYKPCWNDSACLNTQPGYQCLACPFGYYSGTYEDGLTINDTVRVFDVGNTALSPIQDQRCYDIDECLTNNGGCDPNAPCVNTIGSYYCGYCAEGYAGIPSVVCYSTNYCQTGRHLCSPVATCIYIGPKEYDCECPVGYTGNGRYCGLDTDLDGHPDISLPCSDWGCKRDNCRTIPNSGQEDVDGDNTGDDCDDDKDNDGKINNIDNCPYTYSFSQVDTDGDGVGDPCDNCPAVINSDQLDNDKDGIGDECDTDDDNDGVLDASDNCQFMENSVQTNSDVDGYGDSCDNCPSTSNNDQSDTDQNGVGDACNPVAGQNQDRDGDGVLDSLDNCPEVANGDQVDTDNDVMGDVCDQDRDGDGINNSVDNCPYRVNILQTDLNGDQVGDDCVVDSDGDGVDDSNDTCPHNPQISSTSFQDYIIVDLYPGYSNIEADWWVKGAGREIYQLAETIGPSMLIGTQSYSSVTYTGTIYIRSDQGENHIGLVFGYVSNRKFYLVSWMTRNYNLNSATYKTGIKGVEIKLVDSNTGPGMPMGYALWHSGSTPNQTTVLWHDGNMLQWSNYTSYKWFLIHNTDLGKIRFQLYYLTSLLVDSGDIYDISITGGRVGVYQFGQHMSLFSDLQVKCVDRQNMALAFDGFGNYVSLTNATQLNIDKSFTLEIWLYVDSGGPLTAMPVFCSASHTVCLWLENTQVYGQYRNTTINSAAISTEQWTNIVFQYDESEYMLKLFINGALTVTKNNTEPFDWSTMTSHSDVFFFLGSDHENYFKGVMDEIRFYSVAIVESEILDHINLATINKYPKYHKYGQLHFKMDQTTGSKYLANDGLLDLAAEIHGHSSFVESFQDYVRFHLAYPTN